MIVVVEYIKQKVINNLDLQVCYMNEKIVMITSKVTDMIFYKKYIKVKINVLKIKNLMKAFSNN